MAERAASMDMKKNRWRRGFCIYLGVLALVLVATLVVLWVALSRGQARVDADNALSAEQARQEELATEQALHLGCKVCLAVAAVGEQVIGSHQAEPGVAVVGGG